MTGEFVVAKLSDGASYFVLKAGNGEVILTSEKYTTELACRSGIAAVINNSSNDKNYARRTSSDGRYYFHLRAANHQVIGSSQLYASAAAREAGITSVKGNANWNAVDGHTEETPPQTLQIVLLRDHTLNEFREGIGRVRNLIHLYHQLSSLGVKEEDRLHDILRAAVVFLHSTLEEFIRNLFLWKLPSGSKESLNRIPLAGTPAHQRAKPFSLGDLTRWNEQTVAEVIRESVESYINQLNVNSIEDITSSLQMAGLVYEPYRKYFSDISDCIERRHHIVHQMDRDLPHGTGPAQPRNITAPTVEAWMKNTSSFVENLIAAVPN